jgi:hypothetical protein
MEVLNSLKHKFLQLSEQVKKAHKKEEKIAEEIRPEGQRLSKQCGDEDEVYFNQHHI